MEQTAMLHAIEKQYYAKDNFRTLSDVCLHNSIQISHEALLSNMQHCFQNYQQKLLKPGAVPQKVKALNEKVLERILSFSSTNAQTPNVQPSIANQPNVKPVSVVANQTHLPKPAMVNQDIPTFFMPPPQPQGLRKDNTSAFEKRVQAFQESHVPTVQTQAVIPLETTYQEDDILERESISSADFGEYTTPYHPQSNMLNLVLQDTNKRVESPIPQTKESFSSSIHPTSIQIDDQTMKDFMEHMTREPTEYVMDSTIQQSDMFAPPPAQGYVAVSSDQPIAMLPQQIEPVQVPPISATMAFPQNMERRMNLAPPHKKITTLERLIHIDSRDRNLATYPNPSYFVLKFAPTSDTRESTTVVDVYGNKIAEYIADYISDDHNAAVQLTYNNIQELQCVSAVLPFHESYVCGNYPSLFNNSQYDQNKIMSANQFQSFPYGPIFDDPSIGYISNILEEPYLILHIEELESQGTNTHDGTNDVFRKSFAKLMYDGVIDTKGKIQRFIKFKPFDLDYMRFYPTLLANLNTFTLKLQTSDGELANFGVDKIFIRAVVPGSPLKPGAVLKSQVGKPSTRFYVTKYSSQYPDQYLYSHQLIPGDTLYFYNTYPKQNMYNVLSPNLRVQTIYTSASVLPEPISIFGTITGSLPDPLWMFQFIFDDPTDSTPTPYYNALTGVVEMGTFFRFRYQQMGVTYTDMCQIVGIQSPYYITTALEHMDPTMPYTILEIAYANQVVEGTFSDNKQELFYKGGWCVNLFTTAPTIPTDPYSTNLYVEQMQTEYPTSEIEPDSTLTVFEINYPYEQLEPYIRQNYFPNQIFFINKKKQLSYTIRIQQQMAESTWGLSDIDQQIV